MSVFSAFDTQTKEESNFPQICLFFFLSFLRVIHTLSAVTFYLTSVSPFTVWPAGAHHIGVGGSGEKQSSRQMAALDAADLHQLCKVHFLPMPKDQISCLQNNAYANGVEKAAETLWIGNPSHWAWPPSRLRMHEQTLWWQAPSRRDHSQAIQRHSGVEFATLSVNVRQQNTFEVSCSDLFFLRDLG